MDCPNINAVIEVMNAKNYVVFDNAGGHDLNIVGIRSSDDSANTFNDWLSVFYTFNKVWNFFSFPCTTDPGLFYRTNPENIAGTAIVKPGQYRQSHQIGLHQGRYTALKQSGLITVWRDNNRDQTLDTTGVDESQGIFGINIHRANAHSPSVQVDKWSAGCQVLQDPDHFDFFMKLCERAESKYGNSFSYTLLEENDF